MAQAHTHAVESHKLTEGVMSELRAGMGRLGGQTVERMMASLYTQRVRMYGKDRDTTLLISLTAQATVQVAACVLVASVSPPLLLSFSSSLGLEPAKKDSLREMKGPHSLSLYACLSLSLLNSLSL